MDKSKLIKLLRSFSREEQREFRKFLQSPFFNRREETLVLFDLLEKHLKTGKPITDKPDAYAAIFPNEPFDDHRLRMLMSQLFQLGGQFLAVRGFMMDEAQSLLMLGQVLRKRKLTAQFAQTAADLATKLDTQPYRNPDFYQNKYLASLEKYRTAYDMRDVDATQLQSLSHELDTAFLARKLWQSCLLLSHEAVSNVSYDFGLLEEALAFAERSGALETPAIAIFYHCYRALTNPAEATFFQNFKRLLLQHGSLFPAEEMRDLYILAINFCIRRYNVGSQAYLRDQFDFYKDGLRQGYFLTDGELSRYTYQNAVTSGLVMQEFDWVERFIHGYRDKLAGPYRESVFSFNLARLAYEKKQYDKALPLLQLAEYKDLLLNLAAKTLQLKIYFELDEFDLLEAHLSAFKTFLLRKKELGYHREIYLNTIQFTRKLLETNPFDKEARAGLREEIAAAKNLGEKEWLLGQV
ncbi:MAG: hypothetical protein K9J46_09235 [Saprospiraceae bacterium]|nr:hypothetical protein [Saprospiraceae bacterium]MCF8282135.1 hypothetical protein [Bacteroidales bacterium]